MMKSKQEILSILEKNILILDGGMGTMLHLAVPEILKDSPPEMVNLKSPQTIEKIHLDYINAGADIITTNTFGASRIKLAEYGIENKLEEVNISAINIARKAANKNTIVAFSIGPSGKYLSPIGPLSFDEAYENFKEQIKIGIKANPDCIIIETMMDIREAKAAVVAAKDCFKGLVIASFSFVDGNISSTGTNSAVASTILSSLGADVISVNCGHGPGNMNVIIDDYVKFADKPICVYANAGIPTLVDGATVFSESPNEFANKMFELYKQGANILGGCCGTTPEYIKVLSTLLKNKKPVKKENLLSNNTILSSRTKVLNIPFDGMPHIIGEKINPTGRKKIANCLIKKNYDFILEEAKAQELAGASVVDLNVGCPQINEVDALPELVRLAQDVITIPISIDTSSLNALEQALKECAGKPIINSANGKKDSYENVFKLASKYGAAVILLTLDENGIPETAEERYQLAKMMVKEATCNGIHKRDLIVDCVTLSASSNQSIAQESIRAVRLISEKLQIKTALGISNISFGLPKRELINSAFLTEAISAGLNFAIINPENKTLMDAFYASAVIANRDQGAINYINSRQSTRSNQQDELVLKNQPKNECLLKIYNAVLNGISDGISNLIRDALDKEIQPEVINNEALVSAMNVVGVKFDKKQMFLPQVMMSADAMKKALSAIKEIVGFETKNTNGTILMATVKGDIHDIGKGIVATLLENSNFNVIDAGKDVSTNVILDEIEKHKPLIVGLSALMTTTLPSMEETVSMIKQKYPNIFVIIGGAVVNSKYAKSISADGYGKDGIEAIRLAKSLVDKLK